MKLLAPLVLTMLTTGVAYAQQASQSLPTDPTQVEALIRNSGCQYEVSAASKTIADLQKKVNELQAQVNKLDPPKSGATKH